MLSFLKSLFKRDEDPNLALLRKKFKGTYKGLNDAEQAVLMLRLSGMSSKGVQTALDLSETQVYNLEMKILEKLSK